MFEGLLYFSYTCLTVVAGSIAAAYFLKWRDQGTLLWNTAPVPNTTGITQVTDQ